MIILMIDNHFEIKLCFSLQVNMYVKLRPKEKEFQGHTILALQVGAINKIEFFNITAKTILLCKLQF